MCKLIHFRRRMRRLQEFICCCSDKKKSQRKEYVKGFPYRHGANDIVNQDELATVHLTHNAIHNAYDMSIACVDIGEVVMGLGYIFEVLRYPPSERCPTWTLSYSVWNETTNPRLLWRRCFSNIAAFFYTIDATDQKLLHLAKTELQHFFEMKRPVPFPRYFLVIFLNKASMRGAMNVDELQDYLNLDDPKCRGYLIQPVNRKSKGGLRAAAAWLLDKLIITANQTIDIYPDQVLWNRRSIKGAPLGPLHTFALENMKTFHPEFTHKKSTESEEWEEQEPDDAAAAKQQSTPKQAVQTDLTSRSDPKMFFRVPGDMDDLSRYKTFSSPKR